jgi:aromatic ring-opening dioxygenase LigB subunit
MNEEYKEFFLKAIDNENNEGIQKYNTKLIKKIKNDYLQKLQLPREILLEYHNKLKGY